MLKIRLIVFLAAIGLLSAGSVQIDISYSANDFEIIEGDFVRVYSGDCVIWGEAGSPQGLAQAISYLLPQGMVLSSAGLEFEEWESLTTGTPFPAQAPAILSAPSPGIAPPNFELYRQDRWFPESALVGASGGNLSGFSLANITVSPIRWNPAKGVCEYLKSARLRVDFVSGEVTTPAVRTAFADGFWREAASSLVLNPADINSYRSIIDPAAYDWVAIVPSAFEGRISALEHLRRGWGLRDTTIIIGDIYSSHSGRDNAERLRSGIRAIYDELGVVFVLLVGDTNFIPARTVYAMDSEAGFYPDENEIRADLYFADLDGDWDFDGDGIFGEVADSVDMFADVLVGRLSLQTTAQLAGVISKLNKYETIPSEAFAKSGLMIGQVMWDDPYTDGGEFKDDLVSTVFPDYLNFGRVYGALGGNAPTAIDSLQRGPNVINHAGHANTSVVCVGHGSCMFISEMDILTNLSRPSVFYSIGCWPAAFDKDCFAERFVNNPNGGGAAFVGNSRYGWGSPGNAGRGYSEVLDRVFWEDAYNGHFQLGAALNISKARYIPYARWENVWRWVTYQINLLGDPATGLITGYSPIALSIEVEGTSLGATVTNSGGAAVSGAIVSAHDNLGLIDETITDATGFASLSIAGGTPPIYITARLRGEGFACDTLTTPSGEGYFRARFAESWGYLDHRADAGDTVEVEFRIGGFDSPVSSLSWTPTANFPGPLSVVNPPTSLAAGDSAAFSAVFVIPSEIARDTALFIDPALSSSHGRIGFPVSLAVDSPRMRLISATLIGSDSVLSPGEAFGLVLNYVNSGRGKSSPATVSLSCPSGELDIAGSPVSISERFLPGDTARIGGLSASWPAGSSYRPVVPIVAEFRPFAPETLYLATAPLGFFTDVEASEFPFLLSPTTFWHRTTRRANSGSQSWWCGFAPTGLFRPNQNDVLRTRRFILGDNAELRFWAYAQFPNYGSDGLHVEIAGDRDTVELDYIGSGGALLSFIIGWSEYRYSLANLPFAPGDSIEVRFRFESDASDEDEGIFIDDIALICAGTDFATSILDMKALPEGLSIAVFPNPFNSSLSIAIGGDAPQNGHVEIFDINGRSVAKIPAPAGGSDSRGQSRIVLWQPEETVSSGLYLVRFVAPNKIITARAVLLK